MGVQLFQRLCVCPPCRSNDIAAYQPGCSNPGGLLDQAVTWVARVRCDVKYVVNAHPHAGLRAPPDAAASCTACASFHVPYPSSVIAVHGAQPHDLHRVEELILLRFVHISPALHLVYARQGLDGHQQRV
eukprot:CAMPEP_0202864762 /NCGR_PEP_ID=MMETSP1391-20130828/4870_1 /ASSEMBLY_ACC=CAM_ASM_000867 /TAXON_ID=1034604 /ORGANISM="Chlamydomonas leiostraca, Strain SAG 11-49" /LENGTH=129 /DNA_ID=CAMNT_0049544531 /DNA_START=302 /DNA_END=691 /DNA_ORIENTATION=+